MYSYRGDLAYIHHVGYGALARAAAFRLGDELRRVGLSAGTIVDLGCGSGILARHFSDIGYAVVGFDVSDAMLEIARTQVPGAQFHVGSFVTALIPSCVAVAAIGEVLNYRFDEENGPAAPTRTFTQGEDWAMLVKTRLDKATKILTRHITSFRQVAQMYHARPRHIASSWSIRPRC